MNQNKKNCKNLKEIFMPISLSLFFVFENGIIIREWNCLKKKQNQKQRIFFNVVEFDQKMKKCYTNQHIQTHTRFSKVKKN